MPRTLSFLLSAMTLSLAAASAIAQAPATVANTAVPELPASTQTVLANADPSKDPDSVSQVRIVRLSEVRGEAQLDRNTGRGFEPAFANIPLIGGSRLRTTNGLAEVEFEDNSTVRLTPNSEVDFVTLGRSATGATITRARVVSGTVYVDLAHTKDAVFTLMTGQSTLRPAPGGHLRLTVGVQDRENASRANFQVDTVVAKVHSDLAVIDGTVDLSGPAGSLTIPKKSMVAFSGSDQPKLVTVNKVAPAPFDAWNKQGTAYQSRYASSSFSGGTGLLYGSSDLNYYGSFADLPGCGSVWRPYFTNASFDPYSAGTWALYPGAGYSFISPYPWGWLPFHSGSWQQCGAAGWGWNPDGRWSGLRNVAGIGTGRPPHLPLRPPMGTAPYVSVGTQPVATSRLTKPDTFTFRQNSAGLGVPREIFGKLEGVSRAVERHGLATTTASVSYLSTASNSRSTGADQASSRAPRAVAVITRSATNSGFGVQAESASFPSGRSEAYSSASGSSKSNGSASASHASSGNAGSGHGH